MHVYNFIIKLSNNLKFNQMENRNIDPTVVKKWIAIIIAILSAIAGGITSSVINF